MPVPPGWSRTLPPELRSLFPAPPPEAGLTPQDAIGPAPAHSFPMYGRGALGQMADRLPFGIGRRLVPGMLPGSPAAAVTGGSQNANDIAELLQLLAMTNAATSGPRAAADSAQRGPLAPWGRGFRPDITQPPEASPLPGTVYARPTPASLPFQSTMIRPSLDAPVMPQDLSMADMPPGESMPPQMPPAGPGGALAPRGPLGLSGGPPPPSGGAMIQAPPAGMMPLRLPTVGQNTVGQGPVINIGSATSRPISPAGLPSGLGGAMQPPPSLGAGAAPPPFSSMPPERVPPSGPPPEEGGSSGMGPLLAKLGVGAGLLGGAAIAGHQAAGPSPTSAASDQSSAGPLAPDQPSPLLDDTRTPYTAQHGDTLYGIAQAMMPGASHAQLMQMVNVIAGTNGISDPNKFSAGQSFSLPGQLRGVPNHTIGLAPPPTRPSGGGSSDGGVNGWWKESQPPMFPR